MKTLSIAIAGLAAAAGLAVPAMAQHTVVTRHTVTRTTSYHHPVAHYRNVCRTDWHNHHKVRVCHRVRY